MAFYYISLVFVVCCFGVILPASGCNITKPKYLMEFDLIVTDGQSSPTGLIDLLENSEQYKLAIKKIDESWDTKGWNELVNEKDRLRKLSVGLMKCHAFAVHLQCSATQNAPKVIMAMKRLMTDVAPKTHLRWVSRGIKKISEFATTITTYLLHLLSVFYQMGFASPMWMALLLVHCADIKRKTIGNDDVKNLQFLKDINEYLLKTNEEIMVNIIQLLVQCAESDLSPPFYKPSTKLNEKPTVPPYTPFEDVTDEFKAQNTYLGTKIDIFKNNTVFPNRNSVFEKLKVENWLLITPNEVPVTPTLNIQHLLTRPEWKLGIFWKGVRNIMSDTSISQYDKFKDENRNWLMEVYMGSYLTKYGALKQVKKIYLTVITRFVLIGITECDNLRKQIEQYETTKKQGEVFVSQENEGSKNEEMRNIFKKYCSEIGKYVHLAIEYLLEDEFLESLIPELSTFSNQFGKNGPKILVMVMKKLNYLSGFLKVNASLSHELKEKELISDNKINTDDFVKSLRLDHAIQYTTDLQNYVPTMDFLIGDAMERAANHNWIPLSF